MTESVQTDSAKSSKLPVVLALIVVLVLGGGAYFVLTGNGVADSDKGNVTAQQDGDAMIKIGNPVVAKINGEDIKRTDVLAYINTLPPRVQQMPLLQVFPLALEQVVNNKVVTMKADQTDLASDAVVKQRVEEAEKQIIRTVMVERKLDELVTQKALLKEYEAILDRFEGVKEAHARHILVEEEQTAKDLISQLEKGADFAELAKEFSTGPTGKNGGDLGYFAKGDMVPEFADATFALEIGAVTSAPVQTQFGWHVIKLEDLRDRKAPEFEVVKEQLEVQLRQKKLQELLEGWREEAKIEVFDINGEPTAAN